MDENKKSGDTNCKKINELLQEFDKFVEQMSDIKKIIEPDAIVDLREMDNYIKQLTVAAENFTKLIKILIVDYPVIHQIVLEL